MNPTPDRSARKPGFRLAPAGILTLAAVLLLALGAGGAALWLPSATPESLTAASAAPSIAVSEREFWDEYPVELIPVRGPDTTLISTASGRITRFECGAGTTLVSGSAALFVDGSPVIALATSIPLWRDLVVGDRGTDVQAVQTELARLGQAVRISGTLDTATLRALGALYTAAGERSTPPESVELARILWLPRAATLLSSCALGTGSMLTSGEALAVSTGTLSSVSLTVTPTELLPGPHNIVLDSVSVPLPEEGTITEPESLALIESTRAYRALLADTESEAQPLNAKLRLADALLAAVVPPGSVYDLDGQRGCVLTEGTPLPVRILGSRLGQTLVYPEGEAPSPGSVDLRPEGRTACR
ncbi:hypothetical protein [Mycetocola spongiae]|uniref:hypothetical protein n=1 Tax=Mycetocola spongiae TaxID=2859226 RepID=UPI001CF3944E|nr:hypothetical protein [Mycetocola spongiae]UCR90076.1 hypothetical protein KXZ72_05265 [Mycetocola spongiae]